MARFSGATVLLILVATVSVYTCAILVGAALGRALDSPTKTMTKQPWARDIALRVSVSFRGLAEDFAKELWGGNKHREEGRSGGGTRPGRHGHIVEAPSAARVSQRQTRAKLERQRQYMRVTEAELEDHRCQHMLAQRAATRSRRESSRSDGVQEGGAVAETTAMLVSSDSELWGGYHGEEGRSGGGARPRLGPGPGYREVTALPSSASEYHQRNHMGVTQAELEYQRCHHMLAQRADTRSPRETSRSDGAYEGAMSLSSDRELWGGYHKEEGRSGGRAQVGDRAAAAAVPSPTARASVPLSPAELQHRERQRRDEERSGAGAASLSPADRKRAMRQIDRMRIEQWRRGLLSNFSGPITDWGAGGAVKVGPWGGSGGLPFYMRGAGASRLLSITLYHADAVHAFSFDYLVGEVGVRQTMPPSGGRTHGSRGLREDTINLAPDEHLTAVEGTFGHCTSVSQVVVTSLTFRTDKGETYGPYGEETGTPFSIPAEDGCIVGFWGRSGWLLDAIGVYIMPCQVNEAAS